MPPLISKIADAPRLPHRLQSASPLRPLLQIHHRDIIDRLGTSLNQNLQRACPCRYSGSWSSLHGAVVSCSTSLEPCLECCAVPRPTLTMGRSAAAAEGAKVAGPKWLRGEDLLKEATAALSGKKRKRGAEDGAPRRVAKRRRTTTLLVRVPMAAMAVPPLQRLVDACRAVFGGGRSSAPPAPDVVRRICGLMDKVGPDDVGLWDDLGFFLNTDAAGRQNPPIITCKNILQCKDFTIAVFFIPLRAVMPLHDHPGMTVFSKVLTGSAHVEGYDWVRRPRVFRAGGSRTLAEKVLDREFTPASGTWVLFPESGGNMHRFVAGEDAHCAFLDVIAPPYSLAEQRTCTYYKDSPCELCRCALSAGLTEEQRSGGRLAWLREVPMPRDLRIVNLPYRGPTTIA